MLKRFWNTWKIRCSAFLKPYALECTTAAAAQLQLMRVCAVAGGPDNRCEAAVLKCACSGSWECCESTRELSTALPSWGEYKICVHIIDELFMTKVVIIFPQIIFLRKMISPSDVV